jgi:hypothetical protein
MGGFNAMQLALADPTKYSKVVLISPALLSISPFATEVQIAAYAKKAGAKINEIQAFLETMRGYIPTKEDWEKASPQAQSDQLYELEKSGIATPRFLVSIASQDKEQQLDGGQLIVERANEAVPGIALELNPKGTHGTLKGEPVSEFLLAKIKPACGRVLAH